MGSKEWLDQIAPSVNAGAVKLLQLVNSVSPALARRIMIKY